ncbi:MAG: hypothetical protein WAN11_27325, partial [Syntrophobacteraceae bacterium]
CKEIEGLRGGVHGYAAQASPKIDAARVEKDPFRTKTNYCGMAGHQQREGCRFRNTCFRSYITFSMRVKVKIF